MNLITLFDYGIPQVYVVGKIGKSVVFCRRLDKPKIKRFVHREAYERAKNAIIELRDGYNGHAVKCYAEPVEIAYGFLLDENKTVKKVISSVRLRVAEPGKEYYFKWAAIEQWKKACAW